MSPGLTLKTELHRPMYCGRIMGDVPEAIPSEDWGFSLFLSLPFFISFFLSFSSIVFLLTRALRDNRSSLWNNRCVSTIGFHPTAVFASANSNQVGRYVEAR